MKRLNLRTWARAGVSIFCITLLLSSVGPFSDHSSLVHRIAWSLLMAVMSGAIAAWQDNKPSEPRRVLSLDDATAAKADELLTANKRIEAVKFIRKATGADLQTAVDTVNARADAIRMSN